MFATAHPSSFVCTILTCAEARVDAKTRSARQRNPEFIMLNGLVGVERRPASRCETPCQRYVHRKLYRYGTMHVRKRPQGNISLQISRRSTLTMRNQKNHQFHAQTKIDSVQNAKKGDVMRFRGIQWNGVPTHIRQRQMAERTRLCSHSPN